jgi:hypothetical protein
MPPALATLLQKSGMQSGSPFYHFEEQKCALLYAVMEEGMRAAIERQDARP